MTKRVGAAAAGPADRSKPRVPAASRTLVIVLAEVVVIVALLVLWSLLRKPNQATE